MDANHPLRPLVDLLDEHHRNPDALEPGTTLAEIGGERLRQLVLLAAGLLLDDELEELLPRLVPAAAGLASIPHALRR